jgi:haloalkane dehalogenase
MRADIDLSLSRRPVLDSRIAYRAAGSAERPTVLCLHGNPTSSYIWRNILPRVAQVGYAVAPDLIGFGGSGRPDIPYRFEDHARYLDAFIDSMGIESAYLVAQDWGTALAFHLAARRPGLVRGLAFMEFIRPLPTWGEFHQTPQAREIFQKFRTPGVGEKLIMEDNLFLERILPGSVRRALTDEEIAAYRAPFPTPQSRRPIWRLANELPIAGEPADVYETLTAAHDALRASTYPKLLFTGNPGALVSPDFATSFARTLTACTVVHLGPGYHYLQEDHPETIGSTLAGWIAGIESSRASSRSAA